MTSHHQHLKISPQWFSKIPMIMRSITQLEHEGKNFQIWELQLKVIISDITGLELVYLDQTSPPTSDAKQVDRLIRSMIFWSIDESLQLALELDASASQVFRQLKQICCLQTDGLVHHPPLEVKISTQDQHSLDEGQRADESTQRITISGLDLDGLVIESKMEKYDPHLYYEVDQHEHLPSLTSWSDLPELVIQNILDFVRLISALEERTSVYDRKKKILTEVNVNPSDHGPCYQVYQDLEDPILTSFQSLALVDRRTYELCRPLLWEVSSDF